MKTVNLRFYEELNDFLPKGNKKVRLTHQFSGRTSIKDMIESLGIPHVEVDMILANGKSVGFNYIVNDNDDISIYPVFESLDVKEVQHLREKPLRNPKFIADVHLGSLAKYLRMLGIDTYYMNNYTDEEIIQISINEKRTILTKDTGLLKQKRVTHGYYVRNTNPVKQAGEILYRFNLIQSINYFTRCLKCNSLLQKVEKGNVINKIPEKVRAIQKEFYVCENCNKIYWPGTHFERMNGTIAQIILYYELSSENPGKLI